MKLATIALTLLLGGPLAATAERSDSASGVSELSAYSLHTTERWLKEQLSCLGCHRFAGEGGLIAPDLLQLKYRLSPPQVRSMIDNPQATRPGTIMPRVRLTGEKLDRLVAYLFQHGRPRARETAPLPATSAAIPGNSGAATFSRYCAACHGPHGRGDGVNAPALSPPPADLTDAEALARRPDDTLFDIIAAGGRVFDLDHRMPAWGQTLAPPQIRALVAHIRQLCECRGPDWSRPGVTR